MSSKLINTEMKVFILNGKSESELIAKIPEYIEDIKKRDASGIILVNGDALAALFAGTKELQKSFLALGVKCHSVICCRVTPLQKALVVKLVKSNMKCVTRKRRFHDPICKYRSWYHGP